MLSETRQVISLMQTAEIFCLKTHERVNEFHFIDLTESGQFRRRDSVDKQVS